MHDIDIREALRAHLARLHGGERGTVIIDELALCQGEARVDIAVVNGSLNGYEIKSDRDTLDRLDHQQEVYNRCFDTMTIVLGSKHLQKARKVLPEWWGITEASQGGGQLLLKTVRAAGQNESIDPSAVVQLLWRKEAFEILANAQLGQGLRSTSRQTMWKRLVESFGTAELCEFVRERLRARGNWRSGPSPFRGDDSRRSSARSLHSRANLDWLLSQRSQRPQRGARHGREKIRPTTSPR